MWDPIWDGKNRVWRLYLAVVENNSKSARKRALLLEVTFPLRLHAGSLKTAGSMSRFDRLCFERKQIGEVRENWNAR